MSLLNSNGGTVIPVKIINIYCFARPLCRKEMYLSITNLFFCFKQFQLKDTFDRMHAVALQKS